MFELVRKSEFDALNSDVKELRDRLYELSTTVSVVSSETKITGAVVDHAPLRGLVINIGPYGNYGGGGGGGAAGGGSWGSNSKTYTVKEVVQLLLDHLKLKLDKTEASPSKTVLVKSK